METRSTPHSSFRSFAKEIHVLLVDNDKQLLVSIARILEWFSYKVIPVESGLDAISIILDPWKKVDIVLAETRLPDIDGFLLLNETTTRGIPTVLMSADEDVRVAKLALHHGAYFFLAKPPSVDVLKSLWQCVMTENINKAKKNQEKDNKNNISTSPIKTERNKNETNCTKSKDGHGISKNRAAGHGKIYTKWSEELHGKFMAAVHQLGEGKCYPKEILEVMNEPHLTRMQIASHLQKCRHGNWHGPKPRKPIIPECLNNAGGSRKFGSMPQLEKSSNSTQTPPDQENHTDPGKYPWVENSFLPNKAGNEGCTTLFGMYPSQNSGLLSSNFSSTATTGGMINSSNQSPLPSDFFNLPPEMRDSLSFSKLLGGPSRRNYCSIQENRQFEDEPIFFNQHQGLEKPNKGKNKAQS